MCYGSSRILLDEVGGIICEVERLESVVNSKSFVRRVFEACPVRLDVVLCKEPNYDYGYIRQML